MKYTILETIEEIKNQKYQFERIINEKKPKRMSYKDSINYELNKATAEAGLRQIEYVLHLLENTDFSGENAERVKLTDETKGEFEEIIKSQEQIKAEAFDVLKSKIGKWHYKGDNLLILKSMRDYVRLSQEEYEILKKAGLE